MHEEWQLDFPAIYGSAKNDWMSLDWKDRNEDIYRTFTRLQ